MVGDLVVGELDTPVVVVGDLVGDFVVGDFVVGDKLGDFVVGDLVVGVEPPPPELRVGEFVGADVFTSTEGECV